MFLLHKQQIVAARFYARRG